MSAGTEMKVCFNRQLTLDETAGFIAYTMIYCNSIGVDADYRAMEKHLEQDSNCNKPAVSGSLLQSLHEDLKGFQDMGFLTPDAKIGLGIAIEQVERYMRGELEARQQ